MAKAKKEEVVDETELKEAESAVTTIEQSDQATANETGVAVVNNDETKEGAAKAGKRSAKSLKRNRRKG